MRSRDTARNTGHETGRNARAENAPAALLQRLSPELQAALSEAQRQEVLALLAEVQAQPKPKILDIRFGINVLLARYYVVLLMGPEQRSRSRHTGLSRLGNWLAAVLLLLSFNVLVSLSLGMVLYLIKSAVGIDLFPGHLSDRIQSL